ncbi:amidase [Mycoplana sp. BE70]|uniref:amidase n=1 Tax=Mycoplana sp. BE70 TaxID=2817775 RepID=UPI00285F356D|nr:amidase [Mycoplana sp. BE70]MDR6758176.1 amidase [Mycoplana sp. BE70]
MRLDEYVTHDGIGLAQLLANGDVTPKELGQCVTDAVAAVNPKINAVVELYADAMERLPEKSGSGPLHGIPTLTKDFSVEAGRPAEFGSQLARGNRAMHDAVYWQRLRNAGLINVGRTTSSEFGVPATTETLLYGSTTNPWDHMRGVAGSSGGAAAAVAAGIVPFAQGSDGGGSIRNPASFCGLIGLKPSRGRITGSPRANAPLLGLATAFMLTKTVRDTALMLDLCHGPDAGDGYEICCPTSSYSEAIQQPPRGLRIALCIESWSGTACDPEVIEAVKKTALLLSSLGHHVEEAAPQFDYAAFLEAQKNIWAADSASGLPGIAAQMNRKIEPGSVGNTVLALYNYGTSISGAVLIDALATYDEVTRRVGRFFNQYDLLLTPTSAILPEVVGTYDPARQGMDADGVFADLEPKETFTALFNGTGQPAISLPTGKSFSGLPIGSQLVARFGREDLLLAVARQLEECLDCDEGIWGQGIPPTFADDMRER